MGQNNIFLTGQRADKGCGAMWADERSKMKFENKIYLLRFMALQRKEGAESKERHTCREFINSNVACNMHSTLAALCALESSFLSLPSLLPSAWLESTWLGAGSNFYENVACSVCSKALPSCQRQHHSIETHTHTHRDTPACARTLTLTSATRKKAQSRAYSTALRARWH